MGKGADGIVERRRLQQEYLVIQKKKKETLPQFFESPGELNVDFLLYMEHHDPESQLIDAVLNYHEVAYRRVSIVFVSNLTFCVERQPFVP